MAALALDVPAHGAALAVVKHVAVLVAVQLDHLAFHEPLAQRRREACHARARDRVQAGEDRVGGEGGESDGGVLCAGFFGGLGGVGVAVVFTVVVAVSAAVGVAAAAAKICAFQPGEVGRFERRVRHKRFLA